MKTILFILCLSVVGFGQQSDDAMSLCKERAEQIAESLEPNNWIRTSIKQGHIGNCVHYSWMDEMQKFGIKQASFLVEYSWKNERVKFKIKSTNYQRNYFSGKSEITDREILREIKASGLEQQLKDAVIAQAKIMYGTYKKGTLKRDAFTANLFDDEAVPSLWVID